MLTKEFPIRWAGARASRRFGAAWGKPLGGIALASALLLGSAQVRASQSPDRNPRGARARAAQGAQEKQAGPRPGAGAAGAQAPGRDAFLRRLSSLPSDQQEKMLQESPTFQKMPAAEQQRIMDAVKHWNAAGRPAGGLQGMIEHQHAPAFFQQLREMTPEEQERVMQNDERFQNLPSDRQQQIRENLKRWNAATPDERQLLQQREQILESFSPEQRDQLRQIFPRYRQLSPESRQSVMQNFTKLRNLPPGDRDKFLSSPEVQQLSPDERGILGDLKSLLPAK